MDFARVNAGLLAQAETLVPAWLPGGKRRGAEWICADLTGGPGESCSINLTSGVGKDFAGGKGFGDLIALYAAIHGLSQLEAAQELSERYSITADTYIAKTAIKPSADAYTPVKPNGHGGDFHGVHASHGLPAHLFPYRDLEGALLFYVARYHLPSGKTFCPWTFDGERWRAKAWPAPRPLYRLPELEASEKPVLVVEGELKAHLIAPLCPHYTVLSWCGGASAVKQADWRVLEDASVTVWPDNDAPGRAAADAIREQISELTRSFRILEVLDKPSGWDAADFVTEGGKAEQLAVWLRTGAVGTDIKAPPPHPQPASSSPRQEAPIAAERVSVESHELTVWGLPTVPLFESDFECWQHYGLNVGPGGRPWCNLNDADGIFKQFKFPFWYDAFRDLTMLGQDELTDAAVLQIQGFLQRYLRLHKIGKETVRDAATLAAKNDIRHPVRAWLEDLPSWDGQNRIETWLTDILGAPDNPYVRAVAKNYLIALVARVMNPGCQCDTMPVLEGAQGVGKTGALRILGGDWYRTTSATMGEKDFLQGLRGCWVLEIEELEGMTRATMEKVKATLSNPRDEYFARYGRVLSRVARQCVFCGTTNSTTWNVDDTGARRFWPIRCIAPKSTRKTRLQVLEQSREQLFAQALAGWREGQRWHEVPEEDAANEVAERFITDPWLEILEPYLGATSKTTILDCLRQLDLDARDMRTAESYRIARILKQLGWHLKRSQNIRWYVKNLS